MTTRIAPTSTPAPNRGIVQLRKGTRLRQPGDSYVWKRSCGYRESEVRSWQRELNSAQLDAFELSLGDRWKSARRARPSRLLAGARAKMPQHPDGRNCPPVCRAWSAYRCTPEQLHPVRPAVTDGGDRLRNRRGGWSRTRQVLRGGDQAREVPARAAGKAELRWRQCRPDRRKGL